MLAHKMNILLTQIQFTMANETLFGEVHYYFLWPTQTMGNIALAMVSVYSHPDASLLSDSYGTLRVCKYLGSLLRLYGFFSIFPYFYLFSLDDYGCTKA